MLGLQQPGNGQVSSHLDLLSETRRHTSLPPTHTQLSPLLLAIFLGFLPAPGWEDIFLYNIIVSFLAICLLYRPQCLQSPRTSNSSLLALHHPTRCPPPRLQEGDLQNGASLDGKRSPLRASEPYRQAQATLLLRLEAPSRVGRVLKVYKIEQQQEQQQEQLAAKDRAGKG